MSIFGAIKHAIFGDKGPLGGQFSGHKDQPQATAAPAQPHAAQPSAMPQMGQQTPAQQQPAQQQAQVDVEQVLSNLAHQKGDPNLNWRTSIVDLLKLLGLDSSLQARKELANELNVHVGADGSAEENMALQKAVMRELQKNGGKVPASLTD